MINHLSHIPLRRAVMWILLSTLAVSGSAALGLLYFKYVRGMRGTDPKFNIIAIVQTGPEKEALKTVYLAELLGLSVDKPTNLYRFRSSEGKEKLLASPLIKSADVKKIIPGTLYIDYVARKPVAFLEDYTNTAIDMDGVMIPFKPFFTPKRLPIVVLGLSQHDYPTGSSLWGTKIRGIRARLALDLLAFAQEKCCSKASLLTRVDVSHAYASSYGQRQLVLEFEDKLEIDREGHPVLIILPRILRLSVENYSKALADYLVLRNYLDEKEMKTHSHPPKGTVVRAPAKVIDLRIPDLAFLSDAPQ